MARDHPVANGDGAHEVDRMAVLVIRHPGAGLFVSGASSQDYPLALGFRPQGEREARRFPVPGYPILNVSGMGPLPHGDRHGFPLASPLEVFMGDKSFTFTGGAVHFPVNGPVAPIHSDFVHAILPSVNMKGIIVLTSFCLKEYFAPTHFYC